MKQNIRDILLGAVVIFSGLAFSHNVFADCMLPNYCERVEAICKLTEKPVDDPLCKKGPLFSGRCCIAPPAAPAAVAPKPVVLDDPLDPTGKTHPGIIGALSRLIGTFLGMVGALALLVFVYAGFVYMTAGGSDERVKSAKDTMRYALIGLALIMFAYAFASFFFSALTGK